jgi:hypothetical protein
LSHHADILCFKQTVEIYFKVKWTINYKIIVIKYYADTKSYNKKYLKHWGYEESSQVSTTQLLTTVIISFRKPQNTYDL